MVAVLGIYFLPFWISAIFRQQYLTDWRIFANRDNFDPFRAQSAIDNLLINTSSLTDFANAFYVWLYLNFPFKLLLDDALHHKVFALFQFASFSTVMAAVYAEFQYNHARRLADDPAYSRCLVFVLAYSLTQAIFEPDVGSFLRHEIVLAVPLIYILYPRRVVQGENEISVRQSKIANKIVNGS